VQYAHGISWRPERHSGGQGLAPLDVTEDLGNQRLGLNTSDDP
jgi:hypothetical protein